MAQQELEILQGTIGAVVYQNYDNGYADWIMGIQGYGIENGLEDNGGTLNFKYSMDINAMFASENEVNIVVKECEENA